MILSCFHHSNYFQVVIKMSQVPIELSPQTREWRGGLLSGSKRSFSCEGLVSIEWLKDWALFSHA